MSRPKLTMPADPLEVGREIHALMAELYPICRSITGNGFRQTMEILRRHLPIEAHEVPSGTRVFDWTVPEEWNIRDAYIMNSRGEKVVDFQRSNLHVMSYSLPVRKKMSLGELKEHLYSLPEHPDWIPYRTSYYSKKWGFCLPHRQLQELQEGEYEAVIDSTLEPGALTYGELLLPGEEEGEFLVSCHACHPSLANDNLSGVGLAAALARELSTTGHRLSYRFLFLPGTIGAIAWLCRNEQGLDRIRHGLVISGVGDAGEVSYKKSRRGNAEVDRAACHVLKHAGVPHRIIDFYPYGYDERQYCSPGFNLPVGRLSRTPYGEYPQYHTSADDLSFVAPEHLGESFARTVAIMRVLENDKTYVNLEPRCEPQLGKRGIYSSAGEAELAMLWVLNLSDGSRSLLEIAERANLPFDAVEAAASLLAEHELLRVL